MARLRFHCRHTVRSGFVLDAEFEADDGVTGLCGPSGSGKTTTLAIIAGTLRPQQGHVRLGERVLLDTARGISLCRRSDATSAACFRTCGCFRI